MIEIQIANLKGDPGTDGVDGERGPEGPKGLDGANVLPTKTAVETVLAEQKSETAPLAIFRAALAIRSVRPARLVFVGSSTTQGNNATIAGRRYVNLLVQAIQNAYPSGLQVEQPVVASRTSQFGALSAAAGVHGYNGGDGGTTSSNYLDTGRISRIAALVPAMVLHMVGSNDYRNGVPVSTFKANVAAKVAAIRAQVSTPMVQVLVNAYQRIDATAEANKVAEWAEYGAALREIAHANPTTVAFLDVSEDFALVGVPGTDPLDLIDTDNVHPTDAGHALIYDLLRIKLGIVQSTTPVAGTTPPNPGPSRVTSDAFTTTSATLEGRASDAELGGSTMPWKETIAGTFKTSGGQLLSTGSAVGFGYLTTDIADVEVGAKVVSATANTFSIVARRSYLTGSGNAVRAVIIGATVQLNKTVAGTSTAIGPTHAIQAGDRVSLRTIGDSAYLLINGQIVQAGAIADVPTNTYVGVTTGTAGVVVFDDFTLDLV